MFQQHYIGVEWNEFRVGQVDAVGERRNFVVYFSTALECTLPLDYLEDTLRDTQNGVVFLEFKVFVLEFLTGHRVLQISVQGHFID